ncbi:low molecular weight protein-tyrosine-phosphatase [Temperatibacter marinus]|uniref:protein-tyrosine-phosphatase n=1 Tax=Temperatibacter marinus TaxID=1456591 RepID=A0AA52H9X4_9PROT|nr:low molecular weight protein-tyrosine-phosphatase [Temperatibacter marinus]WND03369.1 low molecular weight protein-tyrosine-phosphatase [Temperatibacter marinus]
MVSILFVCMGNICRSPIAEGVFRALAEERGLSEALHIDSAGTTNYHAGDKPDPRSIAVCKAEKIDISGQRSRGVTKDDFENFDLIVVMDRTNEANLLKRCPEDYREKIQLFLPYIPNSPLKEMPDPYYGRDEDFEKCLSIAQKAAQGLMDIVEPHLI